MASIENIIVFYTALLVLVSASKIEGNEEQNRKLGEEPVGFLFPIPRRRNLDSKHGQAILSLLPYGHIGRNDPEFFKWDNDNAIDDDYEGTEYGANELKRQFFGFPRTSRAGRMYSKLGESSQETIKRGGPGGGAGMWFGPRLGRVQKRSSTMKEHV